MRKIFFNLFYLRRPPWDTGITPPELVSFAQSHPPGRALDLGCGTGTNVIYLAQRGWQATGVDFVRGAIRQARRKAHQAGLQVDFYQSDVTRLSGIHGPFDLILDMGCFHSLTPQGKTAYMQNLASLLAPGGTFLLYAFVTENDEAGRLSGLTPADRVQLQQRFAQVQRCDGSDQGRPSAWFECNGIRHT
jgi:cyclopropane fatty-acyl-phospholipid synthase-like methyltransferase